MKRAAAAVLAGDYEAESARLFVGLPAERGWSFLTAAETLTVWRASEATDCPGRDRRRGGHPHCAGGPVGRGCGA
jgi:hypothetical protein